MKESYQSFFVTREYSLIDSALGKASPRSLKHALVTLRNMPQTPKLEESVNQFLKASAITVAKDVSRLKRITPRTKGYYLEILLGIDHTVDIKTHKKTDGSERFTLSFRSATHFGFETKGRMAFSDRSGSHLSRPITIPIDSTIPMPHRRSKEKPKANAMKVELTATPVEKTPVYLTVDCSVEDVRIKYTRPVLLSTFGHPITMEYINDRQITVKGTILKDYFNFTMPFRLDNGDTVSLCGAGGNPRRDVRWISPSGEISRLRGNRKFLLAGTLCEVTVSTNTNLEAQVHDLKIVKRPAHRFYIPKSVTITADKTEGEPASLTDLEISTAVTVTSLKGKDVVVEFIFPTPIQPVSMHRLYETRNWTENPKRICVDAWVDGKWQRCSNHGDTMVFFAPISSNRFRCIFTMPDKNITFKLKDFQFHKPHETDPAKWFPEY